MAGITRGVTPILFFIALAVCLLALVVSDSENDQKLPSTSSSKLPQPCHFPDHYEGRRFQSMFSDVTDDFVVVDCERKWMYTTSSDERIRNGYFLIDLSTHMQYWFAGGRCIKFALPQEKVVDYCNVAQDATSTGTVSLEGKSHQGWVTLNNQNFEETAVVERDENGSGECLPFTFRIRKAKQILMASVFFNVTSNTSKSDLFDVDTSACEMFRG